MNENEHAEDIINRLSALCNISKPEYSIINKGSEKFLEIGLSERNSIFLKALSKVKEQLDGDNLFIENAYLKGRKNKNKLLSVEIEVLQNLLAESLTIGKDSLKSDFHKKFIPFVGGEENRIENRSNNIVFGRRGAGKSSLILYGCKKISEKNIPFAWIAMQQFQNRDDLQVIPQFLYQLIDQLEEDCKLDPQRAGKLKQIIYSMEDKGLELTFQEIMMSIPRFSRELIPFVKSRDALYIFIDDLHLINKKIQPLLLSSLYSFSRGNSIYIKISAIETLTNTYDPVTSNGMEVPGDIQEIRLDYNLVNPEKANEHITEIINSYVKFSGISGIGSICGKSARNRLTWVSAGVPRDALYIFNNAITKAVNEKRSAIAMMDINMAAADSMKEKERYISDDVSDPTETLRSLISQIKDFCVSTAKCNAFLVHIEKENSNYLMIKKLTDLRFLHILHPGITPDRANEKYEALLLDYAFYTGFRRTSSIKEFKTVPESAKAKELRILKKFRLT